MKLSTLLYAIGRTGETKDVEISFITDNSKKCTENTLFVCHENAEGYLNEAIDNGAVFVIAKKKLCEGCAVVEDTRKAFSLLCRCFFDYPDRRLKLIAVTGTNGKTSTASMLHYILSMSGKKAGLIGTVVNKIDCDQAADMTTPSPFEISKMLSRFEKSGGEYCVVEASSQGLCQERLYGFEFEAAIFTNLTGDHLDYHKSFANYKNAKKKLFSMCKTAIINYDDSYCDEFIAAAEGARVLTYSAKSDEASFTARGIRYSEDGITYVFVSNSLIHTINLHLQGDYNVENSLGAIICAMEMGVDLSSCADALKNFSPVKGRMEILETDTPFRIIIDYAHTPDSLRRVLLSLRRFCKGRLLVVFGCGGDREKEKRAEMGKIAAVLADLVFVTTDNPRSEEPQRIIDDILEGVTKTKTSLFVHPDRKKSIALALQKARKGDIILLAGKGHETFQQLKSERTAFDEREIVKELLAKE